MLHMVVLSHGPETCPAVHPEMREKCGQRLSQIPEAGKKLRIAVQGRWADPPGHVFYFVLDAPNAHVIGELMTQLELTHWSTVAIHPVTSIG